jgi:DNA-binding CsgD family transcriptional regulator
MSPPPDPVPPTTVLRTPGGSALDPLVQPQCSLSVHLRRVTGGVVGRATELAAIRQAIAEAKTRLSAITLEGEPGIGKTRLLLAAADLAAADGFTAVAVTADEEIRGPFLLAQSLFASPSLLEAIAGSPAEESVARAVGAITGRDEPGFEALLPDAKLLRSFDLGAVAVAATAQARPLALLVDDVQWADDDTLRLLRYVVRADTDRPIFLFLCLRPDEFGAVTEAVNFVADMERMGVVRRLRLPRMNATETSQLLRQILGSPVDPASAETMHGQSEGVPFIIEELARSYRDASLLQQLDGVWRLTRNAARLMPSAVKTLIGRRAARLEPATRALLADAAVLGRSFSLRDVRAIRSRLDGSAAANEDLPELLRPAVEAGLLLEHPEGAAADYTFTHEQVREFAVSELSQTRARSVHRAVVDLLLESGDPAPAGLPLLAHHALAAGDTERAARFSVDAARAALTSNAPEEALRLVEQALAAVSTPDERRQLLTIRDDAYAVLRRPVERLDGLAELGALVEALRDPALELDVQLRRVATLRLAHDEDSAAELARRIQARAAAAGNRGAELRATLELGQALLRSPLGESFGAAASEVDLDGAEAAFRRAVELAEAAADERSLAAALREVGAIAVARVRDWFADQVQSGAAMELAQRVAAGESVHAILEEFPIYPLAVEAQKNFERALDIYERLGDRTGVMSTVIAMAYINYAPVIHLASSARHLEEIRRVTSRLWTLVTESERERLELQMLFGVHVFARAKVVPDLELSRGEDAYRSARMLGDRFIEFLAAGGMAVAHIGMGELEEADTWIDRATSASAAAPTPTRARQLEIWRGMRCAAAGDANGLRQHLQRAVEMAGEAGLPAPRCEALARLALEAATLGVATGSDELRALAEESAQDAKALHALLPGHAPWGAQADAALSALALSRGVPEKALAAAGSAMQFLQSSHHEDISLDVLLPASRAILAAGPPEMQKMIRGLLQMHLGRIAQGTADEGVRVRWLRGPIGRQLVELAGPLDLPPAAAGASEGATALDKSDRTMLRLLAEGSTNEEMAAELGLGETEVSTRLARLVASLGVSSRAEATSFAFRGMAGG